MLILPQCDRALSDLSKGGIDVEIAWLNIIAAIMSQISSMLKVT